MIIGLRRIQNISQPFLIHCTTNFYQLFLHCSIFYRPLGSREESICTIDSKSASTDLIPTNIPNDLYKSSNNYAHTVFADRAAITVFAGSGGHGCVSFLREKYIQDGPPNGGDGGTGGNVYIQAVLGETSLHKLARRNILRAGRGRNGKGKSKGGERGEDVIIKVPVGTVVREIERVDPVTLEEEQRNQRATRLENCANGINQDISHQLSRKKWLLYPTLSPRDITAEKFPRVPYGRKSALAAMQVQAPVLLDLNEPMDTPLLLAAGAVGGLGNPHFVTQLVPKPKYATKGEKGVKIRLELELKLLADVGLVGMPNAGKSTLLRSLSRSGARVGDWAFTTLQPNIGTAILDNYKSRPLVQATSSNGEPLTKFTIADIPGLVKDAHLDRGLGMSFLRHVERARVLAFVVDLSAGDAITTLKALWKEVAMYDHFKMMEDSHETEFQADWSHFTSPDEALANRQETIKIYSGPNFENPLAPKKSISSSNKAWFVIGTKADLPETEHNFMRLKNYLDFVGEGIAEHPSQQKEVWSGSVGAIPVSAVNGHGSDKIIKWMANLLHN